MGGDTRSTNFPGTALGAQAAYGGGFTDAFVARLNADLTTLNQSTYLGGRGLEQALGLAVSPTSGEIYAAGGADSNSTDFPGTTGGAQAESGGGGDGFVARLTADLKTALTEPPTIAEFSPAKGPVGTNVVITGTNFGGPMSVTFNLALADFTVDSPTQITATVPAGATTGPIVVTTSAGTATSASAYIVAPIVVNGLVTLAPLVTSSDPTPVPGGPAGTFSITATFKNTSLTSIKAPFFKVVIVFRWRPASQRRRGAGRGGGHSDARCRRGRDSGAGRVVHDGIRRRPRSAGELGLPSSSISGESRSSEGTDKATAMDGAAWARGRRSARRRPRRRSGNVAVLQGAGVVAVLGTDRFPSHRVQATSGMANLVRFGTEWSEVQIRSPNGTRVRTAPDRTAASPCFGSSPLDRKPAKIRARVSRQDRRELFALVRGPARRGSRERFARVHPSILSFRSGRRDRSTPPARRSKECTLRPSPPTRRTGSSSVRSAAVRSDSTRPARRPLDLRPFYA